MSKQQTPALQEAFLDMPAMIAIVRQLFDKIEEPRSLKRPTHSLTDCLASCMAIFHFCDRSMLQFERASKMDSRQRNLRRMYELNGDAPAPCRRRDSGAPSSLLAHVGLRRRLLEGFSSLQFGH